MRNLKRLREIGVFVLLLLLCQQNLNNQAAYYFMRKRISTRRWWVRPVNRRKNEQGFYSNLIREIYETDHEEFFGLFRMWPETFQALVNLVDPLLVKKSRRAALPTTLRVAVTLSYLSHADSPRAKHLEFRIGKSTVYKVIHETCRAIWDALQPMYLRQPSKEDWRKISTDYFDRWQFPNCLGAIDGRHMRIQAPKKSGSEFYNYKAFFSQVMLAACDAHHKFTWVDIGQYGSISDGGVWSNTDLHDDLESGEADLPDPTPLPGCLRPFPFVFVADAAFPLSTYLMRPYPKRNLTDQQRVFNYRLSRARLTIENTFGIMTARWRILHMPLCLDKKNAENVFKAIVCLHNFVMTAEEVMPMQERHYCPQGMADVVDANGTVTQGEWRQQQSEHFRQLGRVGANLAGAVPRGMRVYLEEYFNSDVGYNQAPWQFDLAFRGHLINGPE